MRSPTLIPLIGALFLGFSFLHDFPMQVFSSDVGFSAKLIHRDSPESPYHDPNSTLFSRNLAAIHRSAAHNRHTNFIDSNPNLDNNISDVLVRSKFEYIMLIEIGTPRRIIHGMVDSRSHLMWMLCSPCQKCYKHEGRIFKPEASSTYRFHPCHSNKCSMLRHDPCRGRHPRCEYRLAYADESSIKGILSSETLSFDIAPGTGTGIGSFHVPGIVFGCTHQTQGQFGSHIAGLVGLGAADLSLVRQLGSQGGNKFSYCLPSKTATNTQIYFGSAAVVSGPNVMSTPLYITDPPDSLYKIALKRIHVSNATRTVFIEPKSSRKLHEDLILIDSGVPMTSIEPAMMTALSNTLEIFVPNRRVKVPRKVAGFIDICFDSQATKKMPSIKFEFKGGVTVVLKRSNVFMLVNRNILCLAIASNVHFDGESMFGSRAQLSHRIGYDLDARSLTFLPEGC